ncbi:Pyruvate kinase [BD1-7 clade bacterium]|uniref:Pyruvate kinase n=1 Tax=BD1-7 clade bacterium TaxID=2029982 RepID=A0A5S9QUE6_9GAMM|nr:Pyruvate kinase [BD1-7 clade bacterium]CAA0122453.1 Pyruvate kinase [BD1-7 clade bacterium]
MRHTKIICTIGPATDSPQMLAAMADAGMNIARLNMSHGDHPSCLNIINHIKAMNAEREQPVAILMDTQGPEIRTGMLQDELKLAEGDEITVSVRGSENVEESSLQINYEDLITSVEVGDRITVDNGLINLDVLDKDNRTLRCMVVDGGVVKSKRHVNLPGIRVNLPAITEKDHKDILFAIEQTVDFIALSFVRTPDDVLELRELLNKHNSSIKIIAKIEDQEGLSNIDAIIQVADAVMVARGDLGVEINIEDLPRVQRHIIERCAIIGRPVIVATHMLESMIENPIPTRAEVTDIANAVYEEADAIMLSGETTVGKHPIRSIDYLHRVSTVSETQPCLNFSENWDREDAKKELAYSAVRLADAINAKGILVITRAGKMALSACLSRPKKSAIYAFTFEPAVQRQLLLQRGVYPRLIDRDSDSEVMLAQAFNKLVAAEEAVSGDQFVVISDLIVKDNVDAIQVRTVN